MTPPAAMPWPAPRMVCVAPDQRDARRVWLLHTARDGARHAIPLALDAAQMLAEALAHEARAALEGRP